MNGETTILDRKTFKTKTIAGDYCKWSVTVFKNGISVVEQIILSKEIPTDGFTILTTRFGKNIMYRRMTFKFDTFFTIANIIRRTLNENNVQDSDIVK